MVRGGAAREMTLGAPEKWSSCRFEILPNDPRVTCGDSEKCDRRPIWLPAALLPIAQRMNADAQSLSELRLRQTDEASERGNIVARLESALHEPFSRPRGDCSGKLL